MLIATTLLAAAFAQETPPLIVVAQRPDYPAEALSKGIEGDVPVSLEVSPEGKLRCTIAGKGGPAVLQRPSCELLANRWPFGPNLVAGVARPTKTSLIVRWSRAESHKDDLGGATPLSPDEWLLPEDLPVIGPSGGGGGELKVSFDVLPNGSIANCLLVEPSRNRGVNARACPLLERRATFLPAIGPDGAPRKTSAFKRIRFYLG